MNSETSALSELSFGIIFWNYLLEKPMRTQKNLLTALALLGSVVACKPRAYNSNSGVKHNAGDFMPKTSGAHWFHPQEFDSSVKFDLVPTLALQ